MQELLLEILLGLAELLLEFLLEVAAETFLALLVHALRKGIRKSLALQRGLAIPGHLLLGGIFGFLSILLFPHPLMHPTRFHGISLLLSPILTGLFMSLIGAAIRRRAKTSIRIESFGYGFLFAFGMAMIRLIFAR